MNLTPQEQEVMDGLVATWNAFLRLPIHHSDDVSEFRHGIHRLQEKILARPARKTMNERSWI
ncbi:hypothetical protein [Shinella zoogloeoides]|uniref:hypothetical protein n=1 Tax=Shinella zoogloeoides TaxID=352475 RepID=UPI00299DFCED|nr:hypothetical protein [Shinella zoogloeoides]WPE19856.1 hypothetical protein ShzoTeo12_10320 [Shinella zoogloeoides]